MVRATLFLLAAIALCGVVYGIPTQQWTGAVHITASPMMWTEKQVLMPTKFVNTHILQTIEAYPLFLQASLHAVPRPGSDYEGKPGL